MSIRTDLAIERLEMNGEILPTGVTKKESENDGVKTIRVEIETDEAENLLQKSKGTYLTFYVSDFKNPTESFLNEVEVVSEQLRTILPKNEKGALIVGLGNSDITPDALGPKTVSYLFATRHIDDALKQAIGLTGISSVCAIAPGVLGQTGIETAEIISSLTKELKPSVVIVVDALAAKSIDRLGTTIQISNTGIAPGLGVPVVSMGVPMVVDMTTIAHDIFNEEIDNNRMSEKGRTMMVTPREIDVVIEHAAKMVAYAINRALQPTLSLEELVSLVG